MRKPARSLAQRVARKGVTKGVTNMGCTQRVVNGVPNGAAWALHTNGETQVWQRVVPWRWMGCGNGVAMGVATCAANRVAKAW